MHVREAINRIEEIHEHLDRGEVYRGYRSIPVALTGAVALAGAGTQPLFVDPSTPLEYVVFWAVVASVSLAIAAIGIVTRYFEGSPHMRRQARRVLGQFLPCIAAGTLVTIGVGRAAVECIPVLPGIWSAIFALGVFASRPYLPRATGWVALFYLISSVALLALAPSGQSLAPWTMGVTFGVGQLAAATVLYWKIERHNG